MTKQFLILATVSALGLSACATTTTNGTPVTAGKNTAAGAGIGALTGALAGVAISDDDKKGAIIGGLTGAAVGAGIGYNLDKQAAELQQQLAGTGATVTNTGNQIVVNLPQSITFATDSSTVSPSFQSTLSQFAQNINSHPGSVVTVIGHTDSTGDAGYNQGLSQRRAAAVANYLVASGVSSTRISSYGMGETQPVASNDTESGRAQNRRVEVVIRAANGA